MNKKEPNVVLYLLSNCIAGEATKLMLRYIIITFKALAFFILMFTNFLHFLAKINAAKNNIPY